MPRRGEHAGGEARHPTLIGSVQRALHLMEAVCNHPNGAPAKLLAREAGVQLGTAYHLLRTLVHEGYVTRLADGCYVLSDRVASLLAHSRHQAALNRVRPALALLRDEVRAAAYLCLYEDGEIVVREIVDGPTTPRVDVWVGFHDAGHATALGKCVLASLDPELRSEYLARHKLNDLTPNTITDPDRLLRELAAHEADGLTMDHEEYALGTACSAALVGDGAAIGAVGLSMPASRIRALEMGGDTLRRTAARVSRALALSAV
ncbi:MAG: IclR family transcriptional regulator [Chloroflexi bacterium]|nr:MAG: IclR family transcriptional regulator [Chloroflexota bacterium]